MVSRWFHNDSLTLIGSLTRRVLSGVCPLGKQVLNPGDSSAISWVSCPELRLSQSQDG